MYILWVAHHHPSHSRKRYLYFLPQPNYEVLAVKVAFYYDYELSYHYLITLFIVCLYMHKL